MPTATCMVAAPNVTILRLRHMVVHFNLDKITSLSRLASINKQKHNQTKQPTG